MTAKEKLKTKTPQHQASIDKLIEDLNEDLAREYQANNG
jgi:hypothetical protein